jgi:hypothetical protein
MPLLMLRTRTPSRASEPVGLRLNLDRAHWEAKIATRRRQLHATADGFDLRTDQLETGDGQSERVAALRVQRHYR